MKNKFLNSERGNYLTGVFLLIIGGTLLAYRAGLPLPWWLFTWQTFLIALGVYNGFKHDFKNPSWFILIIIGSIFLLDDVFEKTSLKPFVWPIILIGVGVFLLVKKNRSDNWYDELSGEKPNDEGMLKTNSNKLESVAIFSGNKKRILSKSFRGGEIVNIMGGTDVDLTIADFENRIKIECVNIMGGTKLRIPAHWDIESEVLSIFGGVDDKRLLNESTEVNRKTIVLTGVNIFGGIEIKAY